MTAAGDSGQDPGEMVTAGVPAALVRWAKVGLGYLGDRY